MVAITGPSPEIGKSFVSVNLAHVLAETGSRVLLIDADLRRGLVHLHFGAEKAPGLSDLIRGTANVAEVMHRTSDNLVFVPMGEVPPNPTELLGSAGYATIVTKLSAEFDIVLIDTAPVLAVTDAVLALRPAGTTLLVLRAGEHHLREIATTVKRMWQNGVQPHAFVLNDVMPGTVGNLGTDYRYHYQYDYP